MKRNNLINKILAIVIVSVFLMSCEKENNDENKNYKIIKATNVQYSDSDIVRVDLYFDWTDSIASCPYKNDGFTFKIPKYIQDKYLEPITFNDPFGGYYTITMSDTNAKVCSMQLYGYDKTNRRIGKFYLYDSNNDVYVREEYWDRDVIYKGDYFPLVEHKEVKYSYDCIYKKGWNFVYYKDTTIMLETMTATTFTATTQKPSNANFEWYFRREYFWKSNDLIEKLKKDYPNSSYLQYYNPYSLTNRIHHFYEYKFDTK